MCLTPQRSYSYAESQHRLPWVALLGCHWSERMVNEAAPWTLTIASDLRLLALARSFMEGGLPGRRV